MPVYKHKVKDAVTINELYQRYQDGGEYGWYALVTGTGFVAWYNHETETWENTGLTLEQITITTPAPEETIPEEYTVPTAQNVYVSDLARIPVLRYPHDPANTLNELINRYSDGGEHGWYAFIFSDKTFAWWNDTGNIHYWELISGNGGSSDGGVLTSEEQINAATQPALYGVELSAPHSELGISNFSLIICRRGTEDKLSQLAWSITDNKITIVARDYTKQVWSAWITLNSESTFPDATVTTTALAALAAGSDISGKTALEVLDLAINAELFQLSSGITAPALTFTLSTSGLQEVESALTVTKTKSFNRGAVSPQYQTASAYRSGALVDYTETNPAGYAEGQPYAVVEGVQNWTAKANYAEGPLIKGSKGTITVIAGVTNPLAAGSTAVITRSIIGVYPVYATTVNIAVLTKQALLSHGSDITVSMVAESAGKQTVRIPQAWGTIDTLQQYNTLSGTWDNIDLSTFTKTAISVDVNGIMVNYWEYEHNGATIGARQLKFKT